MTTDSVEPVPAATVILTREVGGFPWECFMLRRHVRSEFAADVYVFPGGKVDPADDELGTTQGDPLTAFRMAALRELFEEAGVLLADNLRGDELRIGPAELARFSGYRHQVHAGTLAMPQLARLEGLRLAPERLTPISRWITPASFPRRFDTYFFLTEAPAGQDALHDAVETTHGVWIAPRDALERYRSGNFPLVFATEKHLERLARYDSPAAVVAAITHEDLQPVVPRIVERDGERVFLIPGDEGFDAAD